MTRAIWTANSPKSLTLEHTLLSQMRVMTTKMLMAAARMVTALINRLRIMTKGKSVIMIHLSLRLIRPIATRLNQ